MTDLRPFRIILQDSFTPDIFREARRDRNFGLSRAFHSTRIHFNNDACIRTYKCVRVHRHCTCTVHMRSLAWGVHCSSHSGNGVPRTTIDRVRHHIMCGITMLGYFYDSRTDPAWAATSWTFACWSIRVKPVALSESPAPRSKSWEMWVWLIPQVYTMLCCKGREYVESDQSSWNSWTRDCKLIDDQCV